MEKRFKLFTYAFGALFLGAFVSCSDDSIIDNGNPGTPSAENAVKTSELTVNKANASRVFNYFADTYARSSRAAEDGVTMPEYPAARAAAAKALPSQEWANISGDYIVDGSKDLRFNGSGEISLFITGNFNGKFEINNANPLNIYIAPGASFTMPSGQSTVYNQAVNFYVYGGFDASNLTLNGNQKFYFADGLEIDGVISATNGQNNLLYVAGELAAKDINIGQGSQIYVDGDCLLDGVLSSTANNTSVFVSGEFSASVLTPYTGFTLTACSVTLEKKLDSNSQDFWINAKYFNAPEIFLGGDRSGINLEEGGMVKTESLTFQGNNGSNKITGNGNIVAKRIVINNFDNNAYNFAGHFQGTVYNETATPTSINNHNVSRESQAGAFQPYNDGLAIDVPTCGYVEVVPPHIELVTRVVNHDHNSDKPELRHLSATSITYGNGRYYASYHMRGGNWANDSYDKGASADTEGCIESWTMNGDVLTLGNWIWTDSIDFNHIYFDNQAELGKKVVTMGHHLKKGGIIGYVSENFADDANIGDDNSFKFTQIKSSVRIESATGALQDYVSGGDVNTAYRPSGSANYLITTSRGYTTVNANALTQTRAQAEGYSKGIPVLNIFNDSVSVKHITPYNGGFAVLALDERHVATATLTSPATVYFFDSEASFMAGTPYASTKLSKGVVGPVDGKNVLFANGNELYACLGQGGLVRLNGTTESDWWQRPATENDITSTGKVPVNGVFADANYVYVANGNNLTILDKSLNEVANYQVPNNDTDGRSYSANYVLVNDGLIFVAYGQDGIRVLRLVE